jgi:hypothetical protein
MPIHHRKIDHCPVLPARIKTKSQRVLEDKRRVIWPSDNDSPYLCPIHGTPYKMYSNGRMVFKGYDAQGNKIMEPYPKTNCRCHRCRSEGLPYTFPLHELERKINDHESILRPKMPDTSNKNGDPEEEKKELSILQSLHSMSSLR